MQDLIKAVKNCRINGYDIKILIVGEGDFKSKLIKFSEEILPDAIFTGHINPEELYKYYYASDIFVLPTHNDPWGLVVNEAMACGLPVIVTDAAGSSLDLIKDNGIIVQKENVHEMSDAIETLIEMGIKKYQVDNSLRIISKWSYKESLDSFDIIQYVRRNLK